MQNVAKNFSFIAIATLGITFVIITGGIDLSVGSMMCFCGHDHLDGDVEPVDAGHARCVAVRAFGRRRQDRGRQRAGPDPARLVLAGLGVALIVGLVNGF